jgi:hypothetical protein
MRCVATSKTTGEQCKLYVSPGAKTCMWHGLTGNGARKAEERITLAQLLEQDPRHPWQVVLDATHMMDAIVRDFQTQLVAGEVITPEQLDRLISVNQVRHHLASIAISTKAADNVALAFDRHINQEIEVVTQAIKTTVDKLGLTDPWRAYALAVYRHTVETLLGDEAQGDEPRPPDEPVVLVYDVPALEAGPIAQPCDVAALADEELRSLGERVLDELSRRDLGDG